MARSRHCFLLCSCAAISVVLAHKAISSGIFNFDTPYRIVALVFIRWSFYRFERGQKGKHRMLPSSFWCRTAIMRPFFRCFLNEGRKRPEISRSQCTFGVVKRKCCVKVDQEVEQLAVFLYPLSPYRSFPENFAFLGQERSAHATPDNQFFDSHISCCVLFSNPANSWAVSIPVLLRRITS
jgi:hypothetical protein